MKNRMLVEMGLNGLARAGEVGWFHGHFGAAVLAGERLLRRDDFSAEVKVGILDQVERARKATLKLFEAFPEAPPIADFESILLRAIEPHVEELRLSGHGAIYGALALQALRENPELATEARVNGIVRLLTLALNDRSHRYYGIKDYSTYSAQEGQGIPPYQNVTDMTRHAFAETAELLPDAQVGEHFYFFTAEKLHGVTFAHALATLQKLGLPELAKRGFASHRKALILNRHRPPEGNSKSHPPPDGLTPYDAAYWWPGHFDDHKLKLALAALELLEGLDSAERGQVLNPAIFWSGFKR